MNEQLKKALDMAQLIGDQPEILIDGKMAKAAILALASAINTSSCFRNALLKGRETFCLSSEDEVAPYAIDKWCDYAEHCGVSASKVEGARQIAKRWRALSYARTPD